MEEGKKKSKKADGLSASFTTGAIALVFLILGYQVALFVHKAAVTRMAANRDHPDTVYVIDRALAEEILLAEKPVLNAQDDGPIVVRRSGPSWKRPRPDPWKASASIPIRPPSKS